LPVVGRARFPRDPLVAGLVLTIVVCSTLTAVVSGSALDVAYRSPEVHAVIETLVATAYASAASLFYGRARESRCLPELLLFSALVTLAGAAGVFSLGAAVAGHTGSSFATWAPASARVLGSVLLLIAAFAPRRQVTGWFRDPPRVLAVCALALAAIGIAVLLAADDLPAAVEPSRSPAEPGPRIVGHPVILGLQLTLLAIHLAAAVGFAHAARRHADELLGWLAIAATFTAFARLNFCFFPSLYSEWVYTGDAFRTIGAVTVFFGVGRVVLAYERRLAELAVVEERRRVARELHDGLAQELSFIRHQSRDLLEHGGAMPAAERLAAAADRALAESRFAIAELAGPAHESLLASLGAAARIVAERSGASVRVSGADIEVPSDRQEALTRVVREAVANAVRHGGARHVALEVYDTGELVVSIRDDGCGFDPRAGVRPDAFGLVSMRERVAAIGGSLAVRSAPGQGTTVEVRLA
jgi:signal transduction histidine kinase